MSEMSDWVEGIEGNFRLHKAVLAQGKSIPSFVIGPDLLSVSFHSNT
jgi:hypothetical protein